MSNTFFAVWLTACNLINFDDLTRAAVGRALGRAQAMELSIAARGGGGGDGKKLLIYCFAETTPVSFSPVFTYPNTVTLYAPAFLPIVPAIAPTLLNSLVTAGWTVIALVSVLA